MHNTRSSRSSFPFCLSAQDKETEWENVEIEEAFLRRSFSLADRGSSVQMTLRRLCDKLSSSYYCNCNCYCNRDSYMKCNNNDNNILLLLLFAVTVLFHLSFQFTICMLYQHGTLCTPLVFPFLLSSLFC